ncbi:hypothetical protein V474_15405 [Novosphingobium barchaimii LL02]|uniref:Uncharacterized protein n=2 Tax=Novosphingobium barchaimii TaxID=1420591 RepID=A0A0J7XXT3_9SPHN|nr:hypothetical protein V474_15405 [Novosphingobium barchaimii LL02]
MNWLVSCAVSLSAIFGGPAAQAQSASAADRPSPPAAPVAMRMTAAEAHQGAASDGIYIYAIDNDRIGKYRIATGEKVTQWQGDPRLFPHMNSCTVAETELVCAASNYPAVPQTSAVEIFDTRTLKHIRSVSLGFGPGSLTVMDRHDGKWWAVFANYEGKGGQPGRDYRQTMLVRMDDQFRAEASWAFPEEVLGRMAPKSCSGLSWGKDGLIYATGHDRPEVYALKLPEAGSRLELEETLGISTPGQAIDWDPKVSRRLWSIGRGANEVIASDMPAVVGRHR